MNHLGSDRYQSISSELLTLKATQEAGPEQAKSGVSEKVETPMPSKEETVGKVGGSLVLLLSKIPPSSGR